MRIKNWCKFQHYKNRRPSWIKLYTELLDDPEWHQLDPLAAKVLVMLWMIASRDDGQLPDEHKLAFMLRMNVSDVSACLSTLSHWLEIDASKLLAGCYQTASSVLATCTTEIEIEKEIEKEEEPAFAGTSSNVQLSIVKPIPPSEDPKVSKQERSGRPPLVFECGGIRLTQKGLDNWRAAFPQLDLEAELYALADWAGREPSWFPAVAGALNKRNREMKVLLERARHQSAAKEPANDLQSVLNR